MRLLLLLLLLSALSASCSAYFRGWPNRVERVDISDCPINYFGTTTRKIWITLFSKGSLQCMTRFHPDRPSTKEDLCFRVEKETNSRAVTLAMNVTEMPELMKTHVKKSSLDPGTLTCMFRISYEAEYDFYYANLGKISVLYAEGDFSDNRRRTEMKTFLGEVEIRRKLLPLKGKKPMAVLFFLNACQDIFGLKMNPVPVDLKKNCQKFIACDMDGNVKTQNLCDASQQCDGHGSCVKATKVSCSVFASSVIDSSNQLRHIEDSCSYVLLSKPPSLYVLAKYGYRRRTDTPFLDTVYFRAGATVVELLRGGEVKVNKTKVQLDMTEKAFDSVTLSKNSREVQAVAGAVSITFDGTSCFISAPGHQQNEGLCVNCKVCSLSKYRNMDLSRAGCRMKFKTEPDTSIDCEAHKKDCESFFANESSAVFIKACSDLLCKYGDLDRLSSHIQTCYALRTGQNHSNQSCGGPTPCLNHECAPHEFCGETKAKEPKCICREDFMDPYRKGQKYGEKTQCDVNTSSVELPVCLLEDKGYNVSELRLLDGDCKGEIMKNHMVKFWFSHDKLCGAKVTSNNTHITYMNVIMGHDPEGTVVTHEDLVFMNFSCSYSNQDSSVMTIKILDKSVVHQFAMGEYDFKVRQKVCLDPECREKLKRGDVLGLGGSLYVHLDVDDLDPRVALRIKNCWGSTKQDGGGVRHNLITDGCTHPSDTKVNVTENGEGDHCSFTFRVFRFLYHPGIVHMNCEVELCLKDENDENSCRPKCDQKGRSTTALPPVTDTTAEFRHRRSVSSVWPAAFVSLSWTTQEEPVPVKAD